MDWNLTLWADDTIGFPMKAASNRDVARSWCDPLSFSDVVGVDFGCGEMHLYSSASKRGWKVVVSSARQELLSLQSRTLVVAESAHLATPRTARSLAQPFSETELLELYRAASDRQLTIKLFPHYHSGIRARKWAAARFPGLQSADKADSADAMALALYVLHCNEVSLANPVMSFGRDVRRDYGKAVREYSIITLNAERTSRYVGRFFPHVVDLGMEIYRKAGKKIGEIACHSIASLLATEIDGVPFMFVKNGKPPGVEMWWRNVLMMSPFHHKAGIARSNIMRHSFRPYLRRFGKRRGVIMGSGSKIVPFGEHDDVQSHTRTLAMKEFRNCAKNCYRVGVKVAIEREFKLIDPLKTPLSKVIDGQ